MSEHGIFRVRCNVRIPDDFSPLGTARQRFLGHTPYHGAGEAMQALLDALHRAASHHDGGRDYLVLAWGLSCHQEGLQATEQQALFLLILASLLTMRQGSTRMPVLGAVGRAHLEAVYAAFLGKPASMPQVAAGLDAVEPLLTAQRASQVIGAPGAYTPLLFLSPYLYHHKLWQQEEHFVQGLVRLARHHVPLVSPHEAVQVLTALRQCPPLIHGTPRHLSDEQAEAVLTALRAPVTVITGGPGTGKTTIVFSLLRALVRLGVPARSIALAAPTGKAAQRLGASLQQALLALPQQQAGEAALLSSGPVPQTLHRLLGYIPGKERFLYHPNNPLPQRIVIVDESSMIDLFLIQSLVRALRDQTQLILLGDAEQLPSVEAGAVLRDLIPMEAAVCIPTSPAVVRLRTSYRMRVEDHAGRVLLGVAGRINAGDTAALFATSTEAGIVLRASAEELTCTQVEMLPPTPATDILEAFCLHWWEHWLRHLPDFEVLTQAVYRYGPEGFDAADSARLQRLSQHLERAKILCLTRLYNTGTEALNARLHALWAPLTTSGWTPGVPVLMLHNDYDRQIFNGDQGLVLQVAFPEKSPTLMAVFASAGQWRAFPLEALRHQLTLAMAMTVHKSQGSEFDHVALVLPENDLPLLSREMLYTALTRSRHSVTIVGRPELLTLGVTRTLQRFSGIAAKLTRTERCVTA